MTGPSDEQTVPDAADPAVGVDPGSDTGVAPGTVLRGRYVLEERVATGATAAVWRGFDVELRRAVAVKVLVDSGADGTTAATRFHREAITAARLVHPGIVAVYDAGTDGDTTWLALEHVDGPDLLTVLRHHPEGLSDTAAAAIVEQAAIALGVAHDHGVVHRDVKPANLLLTVDGVVKVSDFGVAATVGDPLPPVRGAPVGTAAYAPPEQLSGGGVVDPRMDVFALGVVLYETLTGRAAFPSSGPANDRDRPLQPRRVRADVDRRLDALVTRATDPDPAARFRDAGHLAERLRLLVPVEPQGPTAEAVAVVRGLAEGGQPDRGPGSVVPTTVAGRLRWIALVAAVLVAVGVAASVLVDADREGDDRGTVADDAGVPVVDVRLYDPYGSVVDEPGPLLDVVDGDPSTRWTTPAYPRPLRDLGYPGVGVRIDTGEPVTVSQVTLELGIDGVTVEVLAREDRPPPGSTELDWEVVARAAEADGTVVLEVGDRTARHWLVWFTSLRDTGQAWQASLTDVHLEPLDRS